MNCSLLADKYNVDIYEPPVIKYCLYFEKDYTIILIVLFFLIVKWLWH